MTDKPPEKPAETEPKQRGCLRRVMACSGWLLLIIVALALVWYLTEVYRCSRFTPTGDALFDRYARAVIHRQAWRLFSGGGSHPATLPDDLLAQWEADFGDDPRYWQLRYWCCLNRRSGPPWRWNEYPCDGDRIAAADILQEAHSRGIADAETLTILYLAIEQLLPWHYAEDSIEDAMLLQSRDIIAAALCNEKSDYSWAYYTLAGTAIRHQRYEDALAFIISGNACTDNHQPICFPQSVAFERCSQIDPLNKALYGAIFTPYSENIPLSWYDASHHTPEFFDWVAARNKSSELSACHKFACRVGSARGNTMGVRVASMLILQVAYSTIEHNAADYAPDQRHMLATLIDRVRGLQIQLWSHSSEVRTRAWMLNPASLVDVVPAYRYHPPYSIIDGPFLRIANSYYFNHPDGLRLITRNISNELHNHNAHTWGEFENISLLDYETLELPYGWWDIGAQNGFPECHSQWMIDQGYDQPGHVDTTETTAVPEADN